MKKIKLIASLVSAGFLFFTAGCSSAPKRAMIVSSVHDAAVSMLESANTTILLGDYEKADFLLTEAYKSSMSIDNYDLLTAVLLTRVSLDLSYNPPKVEEAASNLEMAKNYAQYSDNSKKQLALCTLNEVRVAIASEKTDNLSALLQKLEQNKPEVKGDDYNEAHFDAAAGDIYKLQRNYDAAEKSYLAATKSFTDNRYLSEIGINWYKVAQVRSLNNNKSGALEALENAINYDRLAENSYALATDYYAKGTVLLKGNPTPADQAAADFAFQHSKDIFESIR